MVDIKRISKFKINNGRKMTNLTVLINLISIIILLVVGVLACHGEKG